MPPHPAEARPLRLAALAILAAVLAGPAHAAGLGPASPPPTGARMMAAGEAAAALAAARDRAARADAVVADLRHNLTPGHLTDALPESDRIYGLASLRSDYADAQRRAAGYRATLGDQHPTLLAAEQLLADLRAQLLDATRKSLASAERAAADVRGDVAIAERRQVPAAVARTDRADADRVEDATGSIAAPAPVHPVRAPVPAVAAAVRTADPSPAPASRPAAPASMVLRALAAAFAALLAGWVVLHLARPRRVLPPPRARAEPALGFPFPAPEPSFAEADASGAPAQAPADPVPVLERLTLPSRAGNGGLAPMDEAAGALHATLRAAFGGEGRLTVLVAPAAGLPAPDADAAALALASAAAADGRRPVVMEARAAGRLRGLVVPAGAIPALLEAGGVTRTLYRLGPEGTGAAVLPSDPGEAEAAAAADDRRETERLRGLDGFDTVILVGDDAATLAASADLLLLAAPRDATHDALAAAALPLGAAGRPCGAVLVERAAASASPGTLPRAVFSARRRLVAEPASRTRLGLRGTIEPSRRRLG